MKNIEKNKLVNEDLRLSLEKSSEGLVYLSETDSPIKPVFVRKEEAGTIEEVLSKLTRSRASEVDERPAADFFGRVTVDRGWHEEKEKENVRRFLALEQLLFENLTELRQYRVGRTRIKIFVIGYDEEGNVAGIFTESVET